MIVMPSNATGWFWHSLARETGRLGHLYSPRAQRGPWPWFPYALDNGAFACWDRKTNAFDEKKWAVTEHAWRELLFWSQAAPIKARWAIVPDVPGNGEATIERWAKFAPEVIAARIPLAIAVQDGMTVEMVQALDPAPALIAIGGSDEFKQTVAMWTKAFPRVHYLRCNSPARLEELHALGVESTDGTGWNRGDRKQTAGLEEWCRRYLDTTPRIYHPLAPHVCRAARDSKQTSFA